MGIALDKVTAFVTRARPFGPELLLLRHPNAGVQVPAGTVEENEEIADAVLREAIEETGLTNVKIKRYVGYLDDERPNPTCVVLNKTKVYARPDLTSFDWAEFRRGILVKAVRRDGTFTQVVYEEWDQYPQPEYITYRILGWVPTEALCNRMRQHFFHLNIEDEVPDRWTVLADNQRFEPFWAPLDGLPELAHPQSKWVAYVRDELGYAFV